MKFANNPSLFLLCGAVLFQLWIKSIYTENFLELSKRNYEQLHISEQKWQVEEGGKQVKEWKE